MPVTTGKDKKGCYAQWGDQTKYYYSCNDKAAMNKAKQKAHLQGAAINKASGGKYPESVKEQFTPPESGDAPKGVKNILAKTYSSCRSQWVKEHPKDKENAANKTSCSKIAWDAVKNAGWKQVNGKWVKSKQESKKRDRDEVFKINMARLIAAKEGVSDRPWASVNKSNLPRSAFLIQGDPDKKTTWKLPYKDEQGNVNLGALRAISAAIAGARTGKPMSVPADIRKKIQGLLKQYGIGKFKKKGKADSLIVRAMKMRIMRSLS